MDLSQLSDDELRQLIEKKKQKKAAPSAIQPAAAPEKKKESALDYLLNAAGMAVSDTAQAAGTVFGGAADIIASGGRFANQGNQQLAGILGDNLGTPGKVAGKALGLTSDFLMPQNRFGAAMLPLSFTGAGATPFKGAASKAAGMAGEVIPALESKGGAIGKTVASGLGKVAKTLGNYGDDAAKATQVIKPGPIAKTVGGVMTATSAIPQRYTAAAAADASILSEKTPGLAQVSQEYTDYFNKQMGGKIDVESIRKWTNKDYLPNDKEAGRLYNMVFKIKEAMSDPQKLKAMNPKDIFMGRSAASALQRSTQAATNPNLKTFAQEAQAHFDDALEGMGHGELKDLGRKWFRANVKEQFSSLLPRNKNMSPNALRSAILLNELLNAAKSAIKMEPLNAAGSVIKAGAMSPYTLGKGLQVADAASKAPNAIPMMIGASNLGSSRR